MPLSHPMRARSTREPQRDAAAAPVEVQVAGGRWRWSRADLSSRCRSPSRRQSSSGASVDRCDRRHKGGVGWRRWRWSWGRAGGRVARASKIERSGNRWRRAGLARCYSWATFGQSPPPPRRADRRRRRRRRRPVGWRRRRRRRRRRRHSRRARAARAGRGIGGRAKRGRAPRDGALGSGGQTRSSRERGDPDRDASGSTRLKRNERFRAERNITKKVA